MDLGGWSSAMAELLFYFLSPGNGLVRRGVLGERGFDWISRSHRYPARVEQGNDNAKMGRYLKLRWIRVTHCRTYKPGLLNLAAESTL